jgi:sigma-B regulation protein RsbU (phosphoserine phosphatase)
MTMLPTEYSMCDQDNDLIVRSNQHEFVERTNANPLLDFCLDDLTHKERDALESELNLAAGLQQALLPRQDSSDPGWQICYHYAPAGLLSGDYCDFFESNSGLFFLLGDVSGKGVAASMLKSHLHATFRSLADSDPPLDIMVEAANRIFSQITLAGQFATLVVGRAERDGGVEFVSAGHPPVLHLRKDAVRHESATGIPLGVFDGFRFPSRRLSLDPGDMLLLYTDGLTESCNSAEEEYGFRRIKRVARQHLRTTPSKLISECLSDHRDFQAGAKQVDDLTLLVIRRTG